MERMRSVYPFVLCMLAAGLAVPAFAGVLDPNLAVALNKAGAGTSVRAIVILADQLDLEALTRELDARHVSLAERHNAVVTALMDKQKSQRALLSWLDQAKAAGQVQRVRPLWIANMVLIEAGPEVIRQVAARDDVKEVAYDYAIELVEPVAVGTAAATGKGIEPGVDNINAPDLWALGFDGTGQIVSHLDTGVDGSHAALQNWRGNDSGVDPSEAWFDPVTGTTFPFDSWGHGTHTMGTICGDDGGSNQIGVAPGAKWISAGVIDRVSIPQTYSDALLSLQWVTDPDGDPGSTDDVPAVCSNSWGLVPAWHGYPACDSTLWAAIDGAEAAGVAVVFAAGNEGDWIGSESIRVPGDRITTIYNTFAVGALNQGGASAASFTSRGPSSCDHATIKPEVSAVGVDVRSAMPGGSYGTMSGTSMATPHVAGVFALLRQAFPDATVDLLKEAIYMTAVDLGASGEDNTYGKGRVDALAAYNYLVALCDGDEDGFVSTLCGGPDCNDVDPDVNPEATEVCDGIDNNCADGTDEGGNALCDNAVFCDGQETCGGASGCQAGTNPCPDDNLFCTGTESCDEDADDCVSSGDPCDADEICNEDTDACDPLGDDDTDDDNDDDDADDDDADDDDGGDDDDDDGCGC